MVTLEELLQNIKNNYIHVLGTYKKDSIINEVLLLTKNSSIDLIFSVNTLYLTCEIDMALGNSNYNILLVTPKAIENPSMLQLETHINIDQIFKILYEFMFKKYQLSIKNFNIYSSLSKCVNLNEILNVSEDYLNNPIFLLDTSYRILARSNLAKSVTSSIENHNEESYLIFDTVDLMKKNKCIDTIYSLETSFFHFSDKILIFCAIRINNITTSYICVLQQNRKFNDDDLELTNTLSKVLSIQMQRENLFISNSGLQEEYYLMDLLINNIDNLDYAKERLKYFDFKLNKNLLLISIPFTQEYKDYRHNFGLKELIRTGKNLLGNCISAYYKDMIIFLISTEQENVLSEDIKNNFLEFLKLNNLKSGVSIVFENLLYIQEFFSQSTYALKLSERMKSKGNIFYFEDYLEYYLFSICNNVDNTFPKINLFTLIHPWINKLIIFDKLNNTELLKTLKTYFENNRNANNTSNKLNIHRSTFFYRFHKIENLLNISLDDSNNLFKLELSLKILNYKNTYESL